MITTNTSGLDWVSAGNSGSVNALVLRYGAVLNGLFASVLDDGSDWFLVDRSGRLIDCRADSAAAHSLLGSPLADLVRGHAPETLDRAWDQVLNGRAQTLWPWQGGRARAAMRSIEIHPIRDLLADALPVVGALVVIVDAQSRVAGQSVAA